MYTNAQIDSDFGRFNLPSDSLDEVVPPEDHNEIISDFEDDEINFDDDDVPTLKFQSNFKSYEITVKTANGQVLEFFVDDVSLASAEKQVVRLFGAEVQIINIDVCAA